MRQTESEIERQTESEIERQTESEKKGRKEGRKEAHLSFSHCLKATAPSHKKGTDA